MATRRRELAEAHERATDRGDLMLANEIEAAQAARVGHV